MLRNTVGDGPTRSPESCTGFLPATGGYLYSTLRRKVCGRISKFSFSRAAASSRVSTSHQRWPGTRGVSGKETPQSEESGAFTGAAKSTLRAIIRSTHQNYFEVMPASL